MTRGVEWNKRFLEKFNELAMLSELEYKVLETRIKGYTITQQAHELHVSESTVKRTIATIKKKYDRAQPLAADILPIIKSSKEEVYMDTH